MIDKLREYFDDMVVYKDIKNSSFFTGLNLPSFLRDYLIKIYQDENGNIDYEGMSEFIKNRIPRKEDWISIKDKVVIEGERVKFLTRISIDINVSTQSISFSLPDFGLSSKDTIIEPHVWDTIKNDLIRARDVWGIGELGYKYPETPKEKGKIKLCSFKNF